MALPVPLPGDDNEFQVQPMTMHFPEAPLRMPYEAANPGDIEMQERDEQGVLRWRLPVFVRVEVMPPEFSSECFLVATQDKQGWRGGDGLTVTACANRAEHLFRGEVFGTFPLTEQHEAVLLRVGEWNEMALAIAENRSTYWVNGQRIATSNITEGLLRTLTPCLGIYGFKNGYRARRFDATRDPSVLACLLDRVVILQPSLSLEDELEGVSCSAVSGEVLRSYPLLQEDGAPDRSIEDVGGVRWRLSADLQVPLACLQILPAGSDVDALEDEVMLLEVLSSMLPVASAAEP